MQGKAEREKENGRRKRQAEAGSAGFIETASWYVLAYFKGEGYSDGFSAHMKEVLDELQKGMDVQLYVGTDEICSACPNNREGQCTDLTLVEKYDNAVLEACGLADGEQLAFDDFTEKVQNQLLVTGKRKEICGGCKWNGICENEKSRWEK